MARRADASPTSSYGTYQVLTMLSQTTILLSSLLVFGLGTALHALGQWLRGRVVLVPDELR